MKKSIYSTETEAAEISARADQINEKVDKEMMPKITDLQKIHSEDFEDIRLTCKSIVTLFSGKCKCIYYFKRIRISRDPK